MTVIIAKLSLTEDLFSNDIPEMLEEIVVCLKKPSQKYDYTYKNKNYTWGLSPGQEKFFNGKKYILGRLIRTTQEVIKEYDFETDTEVKSIAPKYLQTMLHYVFDKETELIAFEYKSNLSIKSMCKAFAMLCMINGEGIGQLDIFPKKRDNDLIKTIRSLERISRVKFTLIPSNPDYSPYFKRLDQELKKTKYLKSEIEFSGKNLKFEDTIIEEGTYKVISGQGEANYYGYDSEQKAKSFSSKNYIEKTTFDILDQGQDIYQAIIETIQNKSDLNE